ncbi:hypothetical protein [uncultured Friedmanniella sp.]|uniref:hypothetical protein n=1 Tax=uncultured Friedmanniella sp. TaxID=335381 RepID=UPI0035CB53F5
MSVAVERPVEQPDPFVEKSFQNPALECDIVMKGGITSGVIYPLAVCELAQTYRLRSVGGASAGAIAAAAAAAAEVGRSAAGRQVPVSAAAAAAAAVGAKPQLPPGFLGLAEFPTLLSALQADGRSLLFHLFRPQPTSRRLFAFLTAGLDEVSRLRGNPGAGAIVGAVRRLLTGLLSRSKLRAVLGVLPGLVIAAVGVVGMVDTWGWPSLVPSALLVVLGLAVALVGLFVGALTAVLSDLRQLPAVGFGISSGRGGNDSDLALTPWLYERLQELAGRPTDQPLTFGDLRADDVELKVMTTNLSRAQPLAMPWNDETYFFDPDEFRHLFGLTVTEAMVDNPPPLPTDPAERRERELLLAAALPKRPFPLADQLPVIVAARMSLSFPLLIAAVPLYTVDPTTAANLAYRTAAAAWLTEYPVGTVERHPKPLTAKPEFDRNWFSDGGLTANLPVQFFDSPLPTRPTFAIDLASFAPGQRRQADECENSYLPTLNQVVGDYRRTAHWEDQGALSQLLSFGMSLVQTARGWVDEASLVLPGFRDRVVTVYQDGSAGEGGLNLAMPPAVVERLSYRGRCAAQKLVTRFGPEGGGWENHRWIRLRTATAGLSDWLAAFEHGYEGSSPFYDKTLASPDEQPSYPVSDGRLAAARTRVAELREEIAIWAEAPADAFTDSRPRPAPALRLTPPAL